MTPTRRCCPAAVAALAALLLTAAVLSPAAAQSGTPVTVVNPSTSPANTANVDEPGRIPYSTSDARNCTGHDPICEFHFPPVPANHRLVLLNISTNLTLQTVNGASQAAVVAIEAPQYIHYFPQIISIPSILPNSSNFVEAISYSIQPVLIYQDGGTSFTITADNLGTAQFSGVGSVAIAGYLVDCTIAPCAPIAP
jgi:hypothetical protein